MLTGDAAFEQEVRATFSASEQIALEVVSSSLAALSGRTPDSTSALAFAGCTGCHRCAVYCAHDNDVPSILYAARAAAVRAGVARQAWTDLPARFSAKGHGETEDLAAVFATTYERGRYARINHIQRLLQAGQLDASLRWSRPCAETAMVA